MGLQIDDDIEQCATGAADQFHFVMRDSLENACPARFPSEQGCQVGDGWINGGFIVLEPGIADYIDDDETTKWEFALLEGLAADGSGTLRLVDANTDPSTRQLGHRVPSTVRCWYPGGTKILPPDLAERLAIEKASVIMIDRDLYSSAHTALAFCSPLTRDRTVIFVEDSPGDGPKSQDLGERRAFEGFLDGNLGLVAEEPEPCRDKGKIFSVTRMNGVGRDHISSKTSQPTRAHGG